MDSTKWEPTVRDTPTLQAIHSITVWLELLPIAMMYVLPTLFLVALAYLTLEDTFFATDKFRVYEKTVLVIGGSGRTGRAVATLLAKKGASVVIVGRTKERLKEALQEISSAAMRLDRQRFALISADLTDPLECERVIFETTAWNNQKPPDIIWSCISSTPSATGTSTTPSPSLLLSQPLTILSTTLSTTYLPTLYLSRAALRAWLLPKANSAFPTSSGNNNNEITLLTTPPPYHLILTVPASISPAAAALRSLRAPLAAEGALWSGAVAHQRHGGTGMPGVRVRSVCLGVLEERSEGMGEMGSQREGNEEVARVLLLKRVLRDGQGYMARKQSVQGAVRQVVAELERGRGEEVVAVGRRGVAERVKEFVWSWAGRGERDSVEEVLKRWGRENGAPEASNDEAASAATRAGSAEKMVEAP